MGRAVLFSILFLMECRWAALPRPSACPSRSGGKMKTGKPFLYVSSSFLWYCPEQGRSASKRTLLVGDEVEFRDILYDFGPIGRESVIFSLILQPIIQKTVRQPPAVRPSSRFPERGLPLWARKIRQEMSFPVSG